MTVLMKCDHCGECQDRESDICKSFGWVKSKIDRGLDFCSHDCLEKFAKKSEAETNFRTWALQHGLSLDASSPGKYVYERTLWAWKGWQEAIK